MPDLPGLDERSGEIPAGADSLVAELHAEIADHLATAEESLRRNGLDIKEAQRCAREQFGNVADVVRRCWWIRKGEEVMLRAITVALLALIVVAVSGLGIAGWQAQRGMAGRMNELTQQLVTLTESQKTLLEQQAQAMPVKIRGRAYLGNPSRPAVGATLSVYAFEKFPAMKRVRRLQADERGQFESGPLPQGEYFVTARLLDRDGTPNKFGYGVQSRPLYLYGSDQEVNVDFDLLCKSRIRFVLSESLPDSIQVKEKETHFSLDFGSYSEGVVYVPCNPEDSLAWPVTALQQDRLYNELSLPSQIPTTFSVPEGKYGISVGLFGKSVPIPADKRPITGQLGGLGSAADIPQFAFNVISDGVNLKEGEEVEVRFTLPENLEEQVRAALGSDNPEEAFKKIAQLPVELEITVR